MSDVLAAEPAAIGKLTGVYSDVKDKTRKIEFFKKNNVLWLKNEVFGVNLEYIGNNTFQYPGTPRAFSLLIKSMSSLVPGYEYDIFISYRHNANLPSYDYGRQSRSGWVTEFVIHPDEEPRATIKEPVSVYFDSNYHDGLLETHNVDKSLEGKLKCLIFIPILSQTYCNEKSFAWQQEFQPAALAMLSAALGNIEEALRFAHQACDQHDPIIIFTAKCWPSGKALRAIPGFDEVLKKMRLT